MSVLEAFGPRVGLFPLPVISPIIPNVSLLNRPLLPSKVWLRSVYSSLGKFTVLTGGGKAL